MKYRIAIIAAIALLGFSAPSFARDVVSSFSTDNGSVEIYVGSGRSVFIATSNNNWDTGFEQGSSSGCEFKKSGSCYSRSEMINEVESKTRSGAYWR